MSFSLKPENTGGSDIDYEAIAEQVEDGTQVARVSLIVDLGVQERGKGVSYAQNDNDEEKYTQVANEEEANKLIEEAVELLGEKVVEKAGLDEIFEDEEGNLVVPFEIYNKKDAQEVAIFADLPDTYVDYGENIGEKQYRMMLNPSFKGVIRGFALVAAPPKGKSKVWTFASNSKLALLARVTGCKEILEGGPDNMDIGRVLGKPFLLNVEKKDSFINAKEMTALVRGMEAPELEGGPVGLSFDGATVEALEAARLRKSVIDKIKTAKNYEGSAMQKAIEEYEASRSSGASEDTSGSEEKEEATEAKPVRRRGRKATTEAPAKEEVEKAPKKRRGRPAKKAVPEADPQDEIDEDDIPF